MRVECAGSPESWAPETTLASSPFPRPHPPFEDTGAAKFVVSNGGGWEPVWAHSGRELFYRNGAGEMVAVEVETEPTFAAGQQRALFDAGRYLVRQNYHSYDVTPDGERFVMIRILGGAGERELIVVENFLEELKAKVGN